MSYTLNTTDDYHMHKLNSLGWELTVCNAMYPENSPCRKALRHNASFGAQLFRFLEKFIPIAGMKTVLEVGGGLGYVMKDLLTLAPGLQATMLDISPVLLKKQKETLSGLPVIYWEMDFLKTPVSDLQTFDLVILNEILGDFPTLVAQKDHPVPDDPKTRRWVNKIHDLQEEFSLNFTASENINIGALTIVERLCGAGIPCIFLSEHSCEAFCDNPSFPQMNFTAPGMPEKISLQGHAEFTVKFSHLEKIARAFRYKIVRGRYIDILPVDFNDKVQAALRAATPLSDEQEILQHFVYDLYKYEYLVLINDSKNIFMLMSHASNTTDDHPPPHKLHSPDRELTVSDALYPKNSPCRRVLRHNASFGTQLFHFLEKFIPIAGMKTVMEVGGDRGHLMKDLLTLSPGLQATMLDHSPALLKKQKETLSGLPVIYWEMDFLKLPLSDLQTFDLVILNEILGDFPTLVAQKDYPETDDPETRRWINKIHDLQEEFSLNFIINETINIGALAVLEKLCGAGIPCIFLSGHSCEASCDNPSFPQMNFTAPGMPEKISLQGRAEFTVKFSHLEKIARAFRYRVVRGRYIDILPVDFNDKVQAALRLKTSRPGDSQEILHQFIHDLYECEYLLLINGSKKKG